MTVPEWQSRLQQIIVRLAPEYQPDIHEFSQYHYLISLWINDPERSTITFHVDRKGTGAMSLREWNPEAESPALRAAIEKLFQSTRPERQLREIPMNVLNDLELLVDVLMRESIGLDWTQVEDYRLSFKLESLLGPTQIEETYLVYFKNSGINAKPNSVTLKDGRGSFNKILVESIAGLYPSSAEHR